MKIKETLSEGLKREYDLTLTSKDFENKVTIKFEEITKNIKLPGFRPGKVPQSIIRQRFGDQIRKEVVQESLDEGVKNIIEKEKLRLSVQPKLDEISFDEGKELKAKLICEIMPDISLPDLSKITLEKPVLPIDDNEIKKTLEKLSNDNRPTKKASTGRNSKIGDVVIIDFIGKIDGTPFEGGEGKDHKLVLGSKSFIPGFEEGLVGFKEGAEVNVKLNFPKDYQAKHLAGKEAVFECKIKELLELDKAKIDDELAKKLGFEKLSNLKEAISKQMESQQDQVTRQFIKKELLDNLSKASNFDVPEGLYNSEYLSVMRSMLQEDKKQINENSSNGSDNINEDIKKFEKQLEKNKINDAKKIASRRVRLGLLLTEFGRENDIKVSEEDTKQAIMNEAKRYPGQEKEIFDFYKKNPDALQHLSGPIFEDKVVDYILKKVVFKEKKTTLKKLNEEFSKSKNIKIKKTSKKTVEKVKKTKN